MFDSKRRDNMEISILLMKQIAELFLMILMGYLVVKAGIVTAEDSKVLSKIVLYLVIPCVIIHAFQVTYTKNTVKELELAFVASVLLQIILLIAVWAIAKALKMDEVELASVYYSNSGNLIVPLVTFILGEKWVLCGCVFMSVQLVFMWTHGKKIISREEGTDWRKIVFNINMIAVVLGIVLFFLQIKLPEIVDGTMSAVGVMIGPASMIVTGMLLAQMSLRQVFANRRIYFVTALRLVVVPMISLLLLKFSHLISWHPDGKKILLVVFLAVITPSASTVTQMCQVYGNDSNYASAINVMTTLLSILTMPLMVYAFEVLM